MDNENTERLNLHVSPEWLRIVDGWRRAQEDLPNRSEAIRRMVELAAGKGGKRPK
jgi:hypothetical protein